MTTPETPLGRHAAEVRWTARRETLRLARDAGAGLVTRPMFRTDKESTVRDVEPLAGGRAARDLELAARGIARDYIRQAREAGHGWDQIGQELGIVPGGEAQHDGLTAGDAAYTYAAGRPDTEAPWQPRFFHWHCASCDQLVSDRGLIGTHADNETGHAGNCARLAASLAEWTACLDAELEAEP
jgi:hypothetical protein